MSCIAFVRIRRKRLSCTIHSSARVILENNQEIYFMSVGMEVRIMKPSQVNKSL